MAKSSNQINGADELLIMGEDIISSKDILAMWKCSRYTLWRYTDKKLLTVIARHKYIYFQRDEVNTVAREKGYPLINRWDETLHPPRQ